MLNYIIKKLHEIKNIIDNNINKWLNKYPYKYNLYVGTTEKLLDERLSGHQHRENAIIHLLYNFGKFSDEEELDININKSKSKYYRRIKNAETYAINKINNFCKTHLIYSSLNINLTCGGLKHNKGDIHKIYLLLK
ncbi:hypothetical protein crov524 [Cafeteria roenbergensis virus]|uniref:Uncharacterized protein n=1 Tax=Cafeteria roenbergensis virus (strain BV-PW1) TaxID=693272 RepID=E3T5U5_CROVB|nr:hypothetical protein crov524 [Cafeteria roenbergensis virus BV-PW1]ADO67558.1 hypothetical protein crov524 [Cafeteria roenbergensis virus BV-PW1]